MCQLNNNWPIESVFFSIIIVYKKTSVDKHKITCAGLIWILYFLRIVIVRFYNFLLDLFVYLITFDIRRNPIQAKSFNFNSTERVRYFVKTFLLGILLLCRGNQFKFLFGFITFALSIHIDNSIPKRSNIIRVIIIQLLTMIGDVDCNIMV